MSEKMIPIPFRSLDELGGHRIRRLRRVFGVHKAYRASGKKPAHLR